MRQKLCRRLEELERISAVALRARASTVDRRALDELEAKLVAWPPDPEYEKFLAEQPPEFLGIRVRELRAQLWERAYGR